MVWALAAARGIGPGGGCVAGRRVVGMASGQRAPGAAARVSKSLQRSEPRRLLRWRGDHAAARRPRLRDRCRRRQRGRTPGRPRVDPAQSARIGPPGSSIHAVDFLVPAGNSSFSAQRAGHHLRGLAGRGSSHRERPAERRRSCAAAPCARRPCDGCTRPRPVPPRHPSRRASVIRGRAETGLGFRLAEPDGRRAHHRLCGTPALAGTAAAAGPEPLGHAAADRVDDRDLHHRRGRRPRFWSPRPRDQAALGPSRSRIVSKGFVVWFTGLSGAGKSTVANALKAELERRGRHTEVLDGDEVRTHLSKGLGFSKEDRDTNIRRIGYVARLVARNGGIAITAAISPYREVRDEVRGQTPNFVEVFVRCPLDTLVERDTKGLYRKAIAGEIANFTGVSDPYEEPLRPEVTCDTSKESLAESVAKVLDKLEHLGYLPRQVFERLPSGDELQELRAEARGLPRLQVGQRELSDVFMLAAGALSPLDGFIGRDDYESVLEHGRLAGGAPFTIPIVLRADELPGADRVGLFVGEKPVGILDVADAYEADHLREAIAVYGTEDDAHPGVRVLKDAGRLAIGGPVVALARPTSGFPEFDLTPAQAREVKAQRAWKTMVGFQTRNRVHRAHEYLQKVALEIVDGLLLHPLVGETKADDIPAEVRLRCYEALIEEYFPADRVLLATNPAWMRYAGPREAVFHAIIRRNYGCTHFIVGRDHAGVGTFYDTYAAHRIFDRYRPGELGIEILRFENSFYCRARGSMASTRTCPHPAEERASLSGTRVRELLAEGAPLPVEFTRPEVAEVLRRPLVQA